MSDSGEFFHGTSFLLDRRIRSNGLLPLGPENRVFVTVDPLVARTYATWAAVVAPEPERRVSRGVVYRVSLPAKANGDRPARLTPQRRAPPRFVAAT